MVRGTWQRDSTGYLTTRTERFTNAGYALRFDADAVIHARVGWLVAADWLRTVRVRVARSDTAPLFVGIGRTEDVARYLSGVPLVARGDERRRRLGSPSTRNSTTGVDRYAPPSYAVQPYGMAADRAAARLAGDPSNPTTISLRCDGQSAERRSRRSR